MACSSLKWCLVRLVSSVVALVCVYANLALAVDDNTVKTNLYRFSGKEVGKLPHGWLEDKTRKGEGTLAILATVTLGCFSFHPAPKQGVVIVYTSVVEVFAESICKQLQQQTGIQVKLVPDI